MVTIDVDNAKVLVQHTETDAYGYPYFDVSIIVDDNPILSVSDVSLDSEYTKDAASLLSAHYKAAHWYLTIYACHVYTLIKWIDDYRRPLLLYEVNKKLSYL